MSMCDTCMKPVHCCKAVVLSGGPVDDLIQAPMSFERAEHKAMKLGLPFRPSHISPEHGIWVWWCTNLQDDGRCGDYENRPDLCRRYRPGEDRLCVHYFEDPREPRAELVKAE